MTDSETIGRVHGLRVRWAALDLWLPRPIEINPRLDGGLDVGLSAAIIHRTQVTPEALDGLTASQIDKALLRDWARTATQRVVACSKLSELPTSAWPTRPGATGGADDDAS